MSLTIGCEISNGTAWVDLNDGTNYKVAGESLETTAVQWRRIMATSPVVEGQYQIHAVKDQVTETLHVYTYGATQAQTTDNLVQLMALFDQASYQVRFTLDSSRATWTCWTADYSLQRGQVFAHNKMAVLQASVPRMPTVTYEVI